MIFRKLALATTALSLAAMPVAVQAAPVARTSAPMTEASDARGDAVRALIIVLIAAIGMGFLLLTDDDEPTSP
jgi:hypothetical protein